MLKEECATFISGKKGTFSTMYGHRAKIWFGLGGRSRSEGRAQARVFVRKGKAGQRKPITIRYFE